MVAAATGAGLAVLAALAGTLAAYLGSAALWLRGRLDSVGELVNVPLVDLVHIVVDTPIVASLGVWLYTGNRPPRRLRGAIGSGTSSRRSRPGRLSGPVAAVACGVRWAAGPSARRREARMSGVRVLVGTSKGAFVMTADATRKDWTIAGPFFEGWEIYHVKGSPVDPNRVYASQSTGWFGQIVQRSDDGGATWDTVDNQFTYEGVPGTHQWYDGTPHPWEFARVWHFEPSLRDPDTVLAGVEDAALFRSTDGGASWGELSGLRNGGTGSRWQPGAGGMAVHTIIEDPTNPQRLYVAISAAGVFRSDDGGATWQPKNRGLASGEIPDEDAEVGHCVHRIALHPSRPETLFMQKHWDVMRSDDAGDSWREVSGDLPTDFGFAIDVHAHEPETVYLVPITSDSVHYVPDGALRVYRSRSGGGEWEPLTRGLPQEHCYVNVLRDAMAVDRLEECGVYFGTTGGQVFASPDGGDSWQAVASNLPRVLSVEVQTLA